MQLRVAAGLDAQFERSGTSVSVALCGELDGVSAEPLAILLGRQEVTLLMVDLSETVFVDLAGARALVGTKATLGRRGCTVRLVGATSKIRTVFEAAGLTEHLDD